MHLRNDTSNSIAYSRIAFEYLQSIGRNVEKDMFIQGFFSWLRFNSCFQNCDFGSFGGCPYCSTSICSDKLMDRLLWLPEMWMCLDKCLCWLSRLINGVYNIFISSENRSPLNSPIRDSPLPAMTSYLGAYWPSRYLQSDPFRTVNRWTLLIARIV